MTRFELVTSSLPRKCSTPELHQHTRKERETRFELATFSLEGWRSTNWATPAKKNKNMTVGRTGFEPVKVKPADLQSALVGRLSISPRNFKLLKYVLILSRQRDSNPRPRDYKSRALANWAMPAFLSYRAQKYNKFWNLQNFWEFFLWFLIKYFLKCWKSNRF